MAKSNHITALDVADALATLDVIAIRRELPPKLLDLSPVDFARYRHKLDTQERQATAIIRRSEFKIVE